MNKRDLARMFSITEDEAEAALRSWPHARDYEWRLAVARLSDLRKGFSGAADLPRPMSEFIARLFAHAVIGGPFYEALFKEMCRMEDDYTTRVYGLHIGKAVVAEAYINPDPLVIYGDTGTITKVERGLLRIDWEGVGDVGFGISRYLVRLVEETDAS